MNFRIFWIIISFLAIIASVYLAVSGFKGQLSPLVAGAGWVIATFMNITTFLRALDNKELTK